MAPSTVSIWGNLTTSGVPIIGAIPITITEDCCPCVTAPTLLDFKLFDNLLAVLSITKTIIKQFFPSSTIFANVIADMGAYVNVPPALYVRFVWSKRFPGIKFDKTNMTMLFQLRQIYGEYGFDWTTDPILSKVAWPF